MALIKYCTDSNDDRRHSIFREKMGKKTFNVDTIQNNLHQVFKNGALASNDYWVPL